MNDIRKLLQVNEYQNKIYIPNEIFNDLKPLYDKGSSHVAFVYSYYYLINWLYRYAKYGELNVDVGMIKQALGYSPDNKKINYLIKKNGWLDEIGYTYSDTDYPIAWEFNGGEIQFTMLSDMDDEIRKMLIRQKGKNYKIKVPVKGIWRTKESEAEGLEDGTFYEVGNTHEILFDVFVNCMENDNLGVCGFYLYGYLKYRCQWHSGKYNSSMDKISNEVGMSLNTVEKYLWRLKGAGLIEWEENICKRIDGKFVKKAHTYSVK
ncbi:hypothetical protein [Bacillus sp. T33-2]|uniref:hypothetical protein n=1 Tax=Bacillus sp. T33-2 TaxID=2054168 RepID=UPI000C7704B0|nr:hypothetical protein [Bacillus sp. T33-2]PLR99620.1 hypothetical protein CVD19_00735 [Bacillus sp. T33-2]